MINNRWWHALERRALTVLVLGAVGAATLASIAGCSADSASVAPSTTSTESTASVPPASVPGTGTIVPGATLAPPVTFAGDPSAADVFVGLEEQLPMADDERACAAEQLSKDGALLQRVKTAGATPGSEDFGRLASMLDRCRRSVTFARTTASAISDARGGLPPEQVRCLEEQYGQLTPDELDAVMSAGLNPSGSLAGRGSEIVARMFEGCGVKA